MSNTERYAIMLPTGMLDDIRGLQRVEENTAQFVRMAIRNEIILRRNGAKPVPIIDDPIARKVYGDDDIPDWAKEEAAEMERERARRAKMDFGSLPPRRKP